MMMDAPLLSPGGPSSSPTPSPGDAVCSYSYSTQQSPVCRVAKPPPLPPPSRNRHPPSSFSSSSSSSSSNHQYHRRYSSSRQEDHHLFGTFLKVAKNCLALQPGIIKGMTEESGSSLVSLKSQVAGGVGGHNTKRVRKRHPATIQTPGRRIPTEEESAVEPLTSSSNIVQSLDVFDEELLDDHPFSSSSHYHHHHHHEEELMILGEWEFDEEGFHGQSNASSSSPYKDEWFEQQGQRFRTFSDAAAKMEDMYEYPQKKLSNSLNSEFPVLTTLYS